MVRKRDVHKQFRLSEKEADHFERAVARSGLTQAEYLRQLIRGYVPKDTPPPDYYSMMIELRMLRQSVDRFASLTDEYGCLPNGLNDHLTEMVRNTIVSITNAVIEPRSIERK